MSTLVVVNPYTAFQVRTHKKGERQSPEGDQFEIWHHTPPI